MSAVSVPIISAEANGIQQPTNPYWRPLGVDVSVYADHPYRVGLFRAENGEDRARLWSQTKSLFVYGLGAMGVLFALPESATGWDKDSDIFGKWIENVREGPEWDRNNWAYNYIGHTYSGGVYYQVARKSGYRQWDSFLYSLMMSTFYWEYGVEAFAEPPSIQDLFVTPLGGWVYGEWAYQTELRIRDNHKKVLGSKVLGSVSLFFLDPIDLFGVTVNRIVGRRWVRAGYGYFTYVPDSEEDGGNHTFMLNMVVPIGIPSGPAGPSINQPELRSDKADPVDSGVVGLSVGTGYAGLDDKWGVDDCFYNKVTLGLYFTPRFSSRLAYAQGTVRESVSDRDIDYENYSLDFQYYFNVRRKLRPYLTAGFGEVLWEESNSTKSFQLNAGIGLHWQVHRKWALHSDWIGYFDTEHETQDQHVNVGLAYRFGAGEHSRW